MELFAVELATPPEGGLVPAAIALIALTLMEIVLGIDNIVFIAIITSRLPTEQRAHARRLGLGLALGMRLLLLFTISYIMRLENALFHLDRFGMFGDLLKKHADVNAVSGKDLILTFGGLFLIWKSVVEIHKKVEGHGEEHHAIAKVSFGGALVQIALLDVIFSLDSVITAVGVVEDLRIMVAAIVLAIGVMLIFAGVVSDFVEAHPTIKVLALAFLILIGVMLLAEGVGTHIEKGYIYFAMAFALLVEMINLRMRTRAEKKAAAARALEKPVM